MKRRTEEERRDILRGMLQSQYVVLDTEDKIRFGALPLMMGGLDALKESGDIEDIGAILGDMNETIGSRSMNGIPLFGSVLTIHKEDWSLIVKAYNKEMKRLSTISV